MKFLLLTRAIENDDRTEAKMIVNIDAIEKVCECNKRTFIVFGNDKYEENAEEVKESVEEIFNQLKGINYKKESKPIRLFSPTNGIE